MKKIVISIIVIGLLSCAVNVSTGRSGIGDLPSKAGVNQEAYIYSSDMICDNITFKSQSHSLSDHWGLFVPGNQSYGYPFYAQACELKEVLCSSSWQSYDINILGDGDGITLDEFYDGCEWLQQKSDANDTVLVYLTGHGDEEGFGLGQGYLQYEVLDQQLDQINYSAMAIIIEACHSGAAVPYLQQENRVIITCCKADENSSGFGEALIRAATEAGDCLGDANGTLSEEELFQYLNFDPDPPPITTPQFKDSYPGEMAITNYNYEKVGFLDQYMLHDNYADSFNTTKLARQSFKTTNQMLSKVTLKLGHFHSDDVITVRIYNESGICFAESTGPPIFSAYKFWHTFDFPDMPVIPSETYYIVCKHTESSSNYWFGFQDEYAPPPPKDYYIDGWANISNDGGITWEPALVDDFAFITFGFENGTYHNPPYVPCGPSGPTRVSKGEVYEYSCYGIDPDGDQVYLLFDWGDGTNSGWIGPYDSGETAYASHTWMLSDVYTVKVKAKDIEGNVSDWSEKLFVHVNPPETPIISGPLGGIKGISYEYTFLTTDPDGEDVYYYFKWGDSQVEEWIGPYDSGEEVTISHTWSEEGTYTISAKAKDIHGAESDWGYLEVTMPKNKQSFNSQSLLLQLIQRFFGHFTQQSANTLFSERLLNLK